MRIIKIQSFIFTTQFNKLHNNKMFNSNLYYKKRKETAKTQKYLNSLPWWWKFGNPHPYKGSF